MKPTEVSKENEPQVWINLYENKLKNPQTASQQSRFSVRDLVGISIERGSFKKGYLEDWSKKLFDVKLQDQAGEYLKGTFYSKELSYRKGNSEKKRSCWKSPGNLINTLTANYEYSRNNKDDLPLPVQMQLSGKLKTISQFFIAFFESALNFEHFEEKISLTAQVFLKLYIPKDVFTEMHKRSCF